MPECAWCHEETEQMPGEGGWAYRKRKTCHPDTGRDCREKWKKECAAVKQGRPLPPLKNCESCGAVIPYKGDIASRYETRKICRRKDNPECFKVMAAKAGTSEKSKRKRPEYVSVKSDPRPDEKKPRLPKISQREAERLDAQQREIDRKAMEKHLLHYTSLPGFSLDEHTRRELEKIYTPPMRKTGDIMPHYHRRSQGVI